MALLTIHGYTEKFAINSDIGIYINGVKVGIASRNAITYLDISGTTTLLFKCGMTTGTVTVTAGETTDVLLSIDRFRGKVLAIPTTKDGIMEARIILDNNAQKATSKSIILIIVFFGLAILIPIIYRIIS